MKTILFLSIFSFLVVCVFSIPILVFAQEGVGIAGPPKTLEQLKDMIFKGLEAFGPAFRAALVQGLALWQKMYQQAKDWWQRDMDAKFHQWFGVWWDRAEALFNQRKMIFEEELKKETKEMEESVKDELPKVKNNLWEKFLEIIK